MSLVNFRKAWNTCLLLVGSISAEAALAQSQGAYGNGYSMGPGMMSGYGFGDYGGIWVPIVLVALVAGIVAWIVAKKTK